MVVGKESERNAKLMILLMEISSRLYAVKFSIQILFNNWGERFSSCDKVCSTYVPPETFSCLSMSLNILISSAVYGIWHISPSNTLFLSDKANSKINSIVNTKLSPILSKTIGTARPSVVGLLDSADSTTESFPPLI